VIRVLVASPDPDLADRARLLFEEAGDVQVLSTAQTTNAVTATLSAEDREFDVVVLHEELGPLPVLDLARDLNHRFPHVGVVLLAREPSMDLMRSSMSAGVRSVVRLPLTLAELHGAVVEANEWAQTVQARLGAPSTTSTANRLRGRVIALAGAKGGVGTTTLATQMALEITRRDPDQSVCLVDLDLQTGDVRAYLDLTHRRSITDLIEVASELTTGHLNDAMFVHASGLRVLLPPTNGEDAEDLDGATTARILGGIRARFDTVILDCGSVTTEASAVAVELADEVLLVCTPDVVCLRGANRLLTLWDRLAVRSGGTHAVLNRASKAREIQPSLAAKVVRAPFLEAVIPDRVQDVEAAVNAGEPARLDGPVRAAIGAVVGEIWQERSPQPAAAPAAAAQREEELARRVTTDDGVLSVEFISLLIPVGAVLLAVWQFILAGYTLLWASHAATEAARALAVEDANQAQVVAAARADLHGHWRDTMTVAPVAATAPEVRVTIPVPLLIPGQSSPWRITTSASNVIEPQAGSISDRSPDGPFAAGAGDLP
jgi:pilus assembly protein CpaE